jgi:hypothetical protein
MSRQKWTITVAVIVLLSVGAELAIRHWNASKCCVQVLNEGDRPMDELVLSYSGTRFALGHLDAGASAKVWFSPGGRGTISLEFRQNDNPLKGFQVPDFDPLEISRSGSKLVLVVKSNRIERFKEADESAMNLENLSDRIREWFVPRF